MTSLRHCFKTFCKNNRLCCYACGVAVNHNQAYYHTLAPKTSISTSRIGENYYQNRPKLRPKTTFKWTTNHRRYSTRNLIWEENGETLIRSPHKDVHVPPVSFAEYIMPKLDEYKNLDVLVRINSLTNEPVRDKTNNLGFAPGPTQTELYSHRSRLET